jgi:hypothetical protein
LLPKSTASLSKLQDQLEAELQAELHFASVEGSSSLTKVVGLQRLVVRPTTGCRQDEVGTVKHVERLGIEFQIEPFRKFEVFGKGHVCSPVAGTNEGVAAQIAGAAQTSRSSKDRQVGLVRGSAVSFAAADDRSVVSS